MTINQELIEALWDASNAMCLALPHLPRDKHDGIDRSYYQMVHEAHERILETLRKAESFAELQSV